MGDTLHTQYTAKVISFSANSPSRAHHEANKWLEAHPETEVLSHQFIAANIGREAGFVLSLMYITLRKPSSDDGWGVEAPD